MRALALIFLLACTPLQPASRSPGGTPVYLLDEATRARWTPTAEAKTWAIMAECKRWFDEREIPAHGWERLRIEVTTEDDTRPFNAQLRGLTIDVRWPTKYGDTYVGQAVCHEAGHRWIHYEHAVMRAAGYPW